MANTQESILAAKQSFVFVDEDGKEGSVRKGATVRVGHPLLRGREDMFEPLVVNFEHTPRRGRPPGKSNEGGDS